MKRVAADGGAEAMRYCQFTAGRITATAPHTSACQDGAPLLLTETPGRAGHARHRIQLKTPAIRRIDRRGSSQVGKVRRAGSTSNRTTGPGHV
jgi:hypothetical protein